MTNSWARGASGSFDTPSDWPAGVPTAPSSADVTFSGSSPGLLELSDATKFTGPIAGPLADPSSGIELFNIAFDDNPAINFHNHVLTVNDPITHVTDSIKISGAVGAFSASRIGGGET
jgi:hypothetical protein